MVIEEVEIIEYQVPLIDPDMKSGATVTREDYNNLATKDINSVAATTAGVYQADEGGGINIRGGRGGAGARGPGRRGGAPGCRGRKGR